MGRCVFPLGLDVKAPVGPSPDKCPNTKWVMEKAPSNHVSLVEPAEAAVAP